MNTPEIALPIWAITIIIAIITSLVGGGFGVKVTVALLKETMRESFVPRPEVQGIADRIGREIEHVNARITAVEARANKSDELVAEFAKFAVKIEERLAAQQSTLERICKILDEQK